MRTPGSLRVILNTKLWTSMILEKASSKSLRISALDNETKTPKVFLISVSLNDGVGSVCGAWAMNLYKMVPLWGIFFGVGG